MSRLCPSPGPAWSLAGIYNKHNNTVEGDFIARVHQDIGIQDTL